MKYALVCGFALLASFASFTSFAEAGEWLATKIDPAKPPKTIAKFIGHVDLKNAQPIKNGLPDGRIAKSKGDIKRAWYEMPTRRYGHGVIGDAIEAGALVVEHKKHGRLTLTLPQDLVFEDRYPRLADLNQDGTMEVVTMLASQSGGAAIAIYGVVDGRLEEVARTSHVGSTNRWRNVAGFADYLGNGKIQFMDVVTPHIGGILNLWSYESGKLKRVHSSQGFSNHFIGSRDLELSVSADFDGDGLHDIALPDRSRQVVRILRGKDLETIASVSLPAKVTGNFRLAKTKTSPDIVVPTAKGDYLVAR